MRLPEPIRSRLPLLALLLGALVHLGTLTQDTWPAARRVQDGRDYASYHYAVQVAARGGDPYDTAALEQQARQEHTRRSVHPFFYPPPFLVLAAWTSPLTLVQGYRVWFWLDQLAVLAVGWGLWRLVPRAATLVLGGVLLAAFTPLPNNHLMGQANLPVLALSVWGLHLAEGARRGQVLGGALLGLACMTKMSPALWVAWWLARGRWTPALAAVGAALALSVLALPMLGLEGQRRFYTEVLPGFGSGDYNGLKVPVLLFGNHSIPNLYAQLLPGMGALSPAAQALSGATNLGLTAAALGMLRRPEDGLGRANAAGAIAVLMTVVPVYTYEHHLVVVGLPLVAAGAALAQGRLGRGWVLPLAVALGVLCWPLTDLKARAEALELPWSWLVQEAKFGALVVLGLACAVAARRRDPGEENPGG